MRHLRPARLQKVRQARPRSTSDKRSAPPAVSAANDITEQFFRVRCDLNTALAATGNVTEALRLILDATLGIPGVDCGGIYLPNPRTGALYLVAHHNLSPEFVDRVSPIAPGNPKVQAIRAGTYVQVRSDIDDRLDNGIAQERLRTYLSVPVTHEGRTLCVLNAGSHTLDDFSSATLDGIQAVARWAARAVARIQAHAALAEREEQLRLSLAGADLGIWDRDIETGVMTVNARWTEMLGYAPGEFEPHFRTLLERVHPDDLRRLTAALDAHLDGATPLYECEYRLRHKSGDWIWVQARGRIIQHGPGGGQRHICGTIYDITAHKRAELALQASEERYRSVVTALAEGLLVRGPDGRIIAANASAERILGLTEDQLKHTDPLDPFWRAIHEDGTPYSPTAFPALDTLHTGAPLRNVVMGICRVDGRLTWISINSEPLIRPGETQPYGVVTTFNDITERRELEQQREAAAVELAEREATLRGLVLSSSDGILVTDEDGIIIEWSPAQERISGLTRAAALGKPIWEIHLAMMPAERQTAETLAYLRAWYTNVVCQGPSGATPTPLEVQIAHAGGAQRYIQSVGFGVPTQRGCRFAAITRDVTTQRREAETFVQRQKLESVGMLAGGIAHDFNNIHQAALSHAELAFQALPPDGPVAQHLAKVIEPIRRAADLTLQLMAYAGLGKYLVQAEDLAQIVRDTESLARMALPPGAALQLDLPAGLPSIQADRRQVQQVLMNLLINAGEALPGRRGTVRVTIGVTTVVATPDERVYVTGAGPQPGTYVYLQVGDEGEGMDAAAQAHAFEPFFSTRSIGRGLGLPAALGIVRSHAGGIMLASAPGQGTTITVLWPVAERAPSSASDRLIPAARALSAGSAAPWAGAAPTASAPGPAPLASTQPVPQAGMDESLVLPQPRRHITLVVDDDRTVREALTDILETMDVPTITATNGQEGVALFVEHRTEIGLVILDMLMPVMNGGAALREMRSLDPSVPIVIASGYDDYEVERQLNAGQINARPDRFMQKPFGVRAVCDLAAQYLPTSRTGN
jgi:PAS domain S-box-containing protein